MRRSQDPKATRILKILPVLIAALFAVVLFVPRAVQAVIPGDNVTGQVDMAGGETKSDDFTISVGPVFGPQSGTATIKDGFVTNNANNDRKGGVSTSSGSAFISRGANSLAFDNVNIVSSGKPLVFNIWANCSINANNTTLNGQNASWGANDPFLLIGGYPQGGAGTLNLTGNINIFHTTGAIAGGNNNSVINVNSGTLTIANSNIKLLDGVQFVVSSGATLSINEGSTIAGSSRTAIVVEQGGKLIVQNGSTLNGSNTLIDNYGEVTIDQSTVNGGDAATAIINRDGATLTVTADSELNSSNNQAIIENRGTATINEGSTINANRTDDWTINNYGTLTMTDSTLNVADGALGICSREGGSETTLDSTDVNFNGAGRGLLVQNGSTGTITGVSMLSGLDATDNYNFVAMVDPSGTLNIEGQTDISGNSSTDTSRQAGTIIVAGGTLNVGMNDGDEVGFSENAGGGYWGPANGWRFGGGAINAYNGATVNVKNALFSSNTVGVKDGWLEGSGGAIAVYNSTLNVFEGASFTNNTAAAFGGAIAAVDSTVSIVGGEGEDNWILFDGNKIEPGINTGEWEGKTAYMGAGGAIYVDAEYDTLDAGATEATINGVKVTNNTAIDAGGGISIGYWHGYEDQFDLENSGFTPVYPEHYVPDQVIAKINNVLLEGNTASHGSTDRGGGGMYIADNAHVYTDSMLIHDNHADGVAGGLYSCFVGTSFVLPEGQIAIFDNDSDTLAESNDAMLAYTSRDTIPEMMLGSTDTIPTVHNWQMTPIENTTRGDTPFQTGLAMTAKPQTIPPNTDNPEAPKNMAKNEGVSIIVRNNKATTDFTHGGFGDVDENVFDSDTSTRSGFGIAGGNGGGVTCNGVLEVGEGEYAGFIIKKTDKDTGDVLTTPVGFKLVGANEDGSNKFFTSTVYTDNEGTANFNIVPYGTYYLNEIAPPDDYKTSIKAYKVVAGADGVQVFDNQGNPCAKGRENVVNALGNEVDEHILKDKAGQEKSVELKVLKNWHVDENTLAEGLTITGRLYWGPSASEQYFTGVQFWLDASDPDTWKADLGTWPEFWDDDETIPVVYTVKEIDDDANEVEHAQIASILGNDYEVLYEGTHTPDEDRYDPSVEEKLVIHNGIRGKVTVEKIWDDEEDHEAIRPPKIEVTLKYHDGEGNEVEVDKKTLDESNDWKCEFTDLYIFDHGEEIDYYVEESVIGNYKLDKIEEHLTYVDGKPVKSFVLSNYHNKFTITKTADDGSPLVGVPFEIYGKPKMEVGEDTAQYVLRYPDGSSEQYTDQAEAEARLDQYKLLYSGVTNKDGVIELINWNRTDEILIVETQVPEGFATDSVETIANLGDKKVDIVNYVLTTSVNVEKVWDDADNQDGMRPDSITVNLLADGEVVGETTIAADEDGSWKASFNDLPAYKVVDGKAEAITYTVEEVPVEGYDSTVTAVEAAEGDSELDNDKIEELDQPIGGSAQSFEIKNTRTPDIVSVKVTKVWDDKDNADGIRPASITVHLLADGVDTGQTLVLSADNNWTGSFDELPSNKAGKTIAYTVSEDAVEGYEVLISETATREFTLTNTHEAGEEETIKLGIKKVWDDKDNKDRIRPTSIRVRVYADGEELGYADLKPQADGKWEFEIVELPKYRTVDGKQTEIEYTISEDKVDGYTAKIEGSAAKGYTITNTHVVRTVVPKTGDATPEMALGFVLGAAIIASGYIARKREEA